MNTNKLYIMIHISLSSQTVSHFWRVRDGLSRTASLQLNWICYRLVKSHFQSQAISCALFLQHDIFNSNTAISLKLVDRVLPSEQNGTKRVQLTVQEHYPVQSSKNRPLQTVYIFTIRIVVLVTWTTSTCLLEWFFLMHAKFGLFFFTTIAAQYGLFYYDLISMFLWYARSNIKVTQGLHWRSATYSVLTNLFKLPGSL